MQCKPCLVSNLIQFANSTAGFFSKKPCDHPSLILDSLLDPLPKLFETTIRTINYKLFHFRNALCCKLSSGANPLQSVHVVVLTRSKEASTALSFGRPLKLSLSKRRCILRLLLRHLLTTIIIMLTKFKLGDFSKSLTNLFLEIPNGNCYIGKMTKSLKSKSTIQRTKN